MPAVPSVPASSVAEPVTVETHTVKKEPEAAETESLTTSVLQDLLEDVFITGTDQAECNQELVQIEVAKFRCEAPALLNSDPLLW